MMLHTSQISHTEKENIYRNAFDVLNILNSKKRLDYIFRKYLMFIVKKQPLLVLPNDFTSPDCYASNHPAIETHFFFPSLKMCLMFHGNSIVVDLTHAIRQKYQRFTKNKVKL